MRMPQKQCSDMTSELIKKKIDMVMQDTICLYKNQEKKKSDWMMQGERRDMIGCDLFSSFIIKIMY